MRFDELGLAPELLKAVSDKGYETPTPIQAQAIPIVLSGKDLMGGAQTGTGKTAAFTLPLLQRILPFASASPSPARHPVRVLMLAPTRELAIQVHESVRDYSKYVPIRSLCAFGGVDIKPQIEEIRLGIEVLVATPGRLLDLVEQKCLNFGQVQALVLDEADRMLDMGFIPDVTRILKMLPAQRQSLLFSATFSDDIKKLADTMLRAPARHATLDEWAHEIGMSERNMSRLFLAETGLSVHKWRRQMHVLTALPLLAHGQSLQSISEDLGYDSSGAFVTMFRKTLGAPPKRFLQERTAGIHAPLNVPSGNFYEYQ